MAREAAAIIRGVRRLLRFAVIMMLCYNAASITKRCQGPGCILLLSRSNKLGFTAVSMQRWERIERRAHPARARVLNQRQPGRAKDGLHLQSDAD